MATELKAIGVVKGRVQALSNQGRLDFILYDSLFDLPVTCYLQERQENLLRELWGKQVFVAGLVIRDANSGHATAVRDITSIDPVIEVVPGSYKLTRGILAWSEGDEPAEVSIRRIRDDNF